MLRGTPTDSSGQRSRIWPPRLSRQREQFATLIEYHIVNVAGAELRLMVNGNYSGTAIFTYPELQTTLSGESRIESAEHGWL
jgi:hypothetical protein